MHFSCSSLAGRKSQPSGPFDMKSIIIITFWNSHGLKTEQLRTFLRVRCGKYYPETLILGRIRIIRKEQAESGSEERFAKHIGKGNQYIPQKVVEWARKQRADGSIGELDFYEATKFDIGDNLIAELKKDLPTETINQLRTVDVEKDVDKVTAVGFTTKSDIIMIFWSSRGLYGPPLINFLSTRCNVKWDLLQINTRIGDIRELQRLEKGDDQDFYDHSVEDARCRWNHKLVDEWVKEQKSKSKMSEKDYVDATKLQVDDGLVVEISDEAEKMGLDIDELLRVEVGSSDTRSPSPGFWWLPEPEPDMLKYFERLEAEAFAQIKIWRPEEAEAYAQMQLGAQEEFEEADSEGGE